MRRATIAAGLSALAACAPLPAPAPPKPPAASSGYVCLLPAEHRMLVAELFFGRVGNAAWADFAARVITPNFPNGFTTFDGDGQWRNPQSGAIARERTKILLVAAPREPGLAARLTAVIDAYKARFRQQAVGIITRDSCAAF